MSSIADRFGIMLSRTQEYLLVFSILSIALLTLANVVCRFLLGFSLAVTEELIQFAMVAICFVGIAYAATRARHIRMTAIYDQLPHPLQKVLLTTVHLLTCFLMVGLTFFSIRYVYGIYQLGGIYPATRVPFFLVYSIAPVGFALASAEYLLAFLRNLTTSEIYLSYSVPETPNNSSAGDQTSNAETQIVEQGTGGAL